MPTQYWPSVSIASNTRTRRASTLRIYNISYYEPRPARPISLVCPLCTKSRPPTIAIRPLLYSSPTGRPSGCVYEIRKTWCAMNIAQHATTTLLPLDLTWCPQAQQRASPTTWQTWAPWQPAAQTLSNKHSNSVELFPLSLTHLLGSDSSNENDECSIAGRERATTPITYAAGKVARSDLLGRPCIGRPVSLSLRTFFCAVDLYAACILPLINDSV